MQEDDEDEEDEDFDDDQEYDGPEINRDELIEKYQVCFKSFSNKVKVL